MFCRSVADTIVMLWRGFCEALAMLLLVRGGETLTKMAISFHSCLQTELVMRGGTEIRRPEYLVLNGLRRCV